MRKTDLAFVFDNNLFGTTDSSNFDNPDGVGDDSCDPVWHSDLNKWSLQHQLGTCGHVTTLEK